MNRQVNRLRNGLVGLLVLQLILAVGLLLNANRDESDYAPGPLLAFAASRLDKIVIGDGEDEVTLAKQDDAWQLPTLDNLPVDGGQLEALLNKLATLQTTWPVATTSGSHARFEVGDDNHQRRIQLYQGDEPEAELLLGTSPGFRQVHARKPGDAEVYSVPINTYEVPAQADDWLDKKFLAIPGITAIKGADFRLIQQDNTWVLADGNGDEVNADKVDSAKTGQLARALNALTVTGIARNPPDFATEAVITLEITSGENTRHYHFLAQDEAYYVKPDHQQQVFTMSQYEYDRVAIVQWSDFLAEAEETEVEGTEGIEGLEGIEAIEEK